MIGYAPFLGQVRLIQSHRMGQELPYLELSRSLNALIDELVNEIRQLPEPLQPPLLYRATECRMWAANLGIQTKVEPATTAKNKIEECIKDLQNGIRDAAKSLTPTETSTMVPSMGVPTWGYVAGGVAAIALIALLAS